MAKALVNHSFAGADNYFLLINFSGLIFLGRDEQAAICFQSIIAQQFFIFKETIFFYSNRKLYLEYHMPR